MESKIHSTAGFCILVLLFFQQISKFHDCEASCAFCFKHIWIQQNAKWKYWKALKPWQRRNNNMMQYDFLHRTTCDASHTLTHTTALTNRMLKIQTVCWVRSQWLSNRRVQESKSFNPITTVEVTLQSLLLEFTKNSYRTNWTHRDWLSIKRAVTVTANHRCHSASVSCTHIRPLWLVHCPALLPYSLSSTLFLSFLSELVLHMVTPAEFRDHPSFMCSRSSYTVDTSLFLSLLLLCVYVPMFLWTPLCRGCIKENEAVMYRNILSDVTEVAAACLKLEDE